MHLGSRAMEKWLAFNLASSGYESKAKFQKGRVVEKGKQKEECGLDTLRNNSFLKHFF